MGSLSTHTPFQWLRDLERRAKQRAKGLPRQEKIQQYWRGIAFRIADVSLVSSLVDIREILPCPTHLARVPGAKPWIKGIANIRGQLLPVIDLQGCLVAKMIVADSKKRLLIINQAGISAGLLVDEVLGIKHFPEHLHDHNSPCKEAWMTPFSKGLFAYEGQTWTVFDMHTLAESDTFLKAAL